MPSPNQHSPQFHLSQLARRHLIFLRRFVRHHPHLELKYSKSSPLTSHHRRHKHHLDTIVVLYCIQIFLTTPLLFSLGLDAEQRRQFLVKKPLNILHKLGFPLDEVLMLKDYQSLPVEINNLLISSP
uniref:Uncharacterized protein n=1 Tax=Ditylenchus dipsaci TaxID=166011 RepID=A0A915CS29_9BILA